jgi:hypothetical protein
VTKGDFGPSQMPSVGGHSIQFSGLMLFLLLTYLVTGEIESTLVSLLRGPCMLQEMIAYL